MSVRSTYREKKNKHGCGDGGREGGEVGRRPHGLASPRETCGQAAWRSSSILNESDLHCLPPSSSPSSLLAVFAPYRSIRSEPAGPKGLVIDRHSDRGYDGKGTPTLVHRWPLLPPRTADAGKRLGIRPHPLENCRPWKTSSTTKKRGIALLR